MGSLLWEKKRIGFCISLCGVLCWLFLGEHLLQAIHQSEMIQLKCDPIQSKLIGFTFTFTIAITLTRSILLGITITALIIIVSMIYFGKCITLDWMDYTFNGIGWRYWILLQTIDDQSPSIVYDVDNLYRFGGIYRTDKEEEEMQMQMIIT